MYPLLLAISFILHLFAFFWIFLLSIRLKRASEIENRQNEIQKEIEDLFQSYLLEMKEENEKLLNMLEKSPNTKISKTAPVKNDRINVETYEVPENLRSKVTQQVYQNQNPQKPRLSSEEEKKKDYVPPIPIGEDKFEQSLSSQVVLLHEKGLQPAEIAQKLNKGKAEIELLLKFSGQKHN